MMPDELKNILNVGETDSIEFVSTVNVERVAKAVCSLLNAHGGRVIVGVDDHGKVLGIEDAQQTAKQLEQSLRDRVAPQSMLSSSVESVDGREFIVLDVPSGYIKPYLVDGTIWMRRGSSVVPAKADEVHQLIQERTLSDRRWECRPALSIGIDALDTEEIRKAAAEIQTAGRRQFKRADDPLAVLEDLGLVETGQITNAAVVLFGLSPSRVHPQLRTRLTVFESNKTGSELLMDETIEHHLFGTLARLTELFQRWIPIRSSFPEGNWQRRDEWDFPPKALREGVLNALVHRDFASPSGSLRVEVYPERLAIWNIGALPNGMDAKMLGSEHPSLPRNPDIANVCFLRGFIEQIGRGTVMILQECSRAGLQRPRWESDGIGTRLTLFGRQRSRKTMTAALNQRQLRLLKDLPTGQGLTLSQYHAMLEGAAVTDRTVRNDLSQLVSAGFLRQQGKGRGTFYVRTDLLFQP
ncbi:MAG: RNA-binding domain-containing protein [Planctomycetaceae bacterium]